MTIDRMSAENTEPSKVNDESTKATVKRHRSLKSEMFHGFVWLYSKMITPLLVSAILGSCWFIYYFTMIRAGMSTILVLGFMMVIIVSVIALFQSVEEHEHEGVELTREEAPVIWRVIDEISKQADCRPITRLVIDGDLNAYAAERRSQKGLGPRELEVGIGLPLLAALEPDEVSSVIAHEIGHHNGDDARRSLSIFKAFARCEHVVDSTSEFSIPWFLTSLIFKPYRYGLYLLGQKLRHESEFEADRFAARVCGVEASGRADVALAVFGEDLTEVIHEPFRKALMEGTGSPADLFDDLPKRFRQALDSSKFKSKLVEALAEETDFWSSHPSVSARLKNIGATANLPAFDENRVAAKQWLGSRYDMVAEAIQKKWAQKYEEIDEYVKPARQFHEFNKYLREKAKEQISKCPDDADALLIYAQASSETLEDDELTGVLKGVLATGVFNPEVDVLLASHEISQNNPRGVTRLFDVIERKLEFQTLNALQHLEELREWSDWHKREDCKGFEEIYDIAADAEVKSVLNQLREPLSEIAQEQEACFAGELRPAIFADWHKELLIAWFRTNSEISKGWIFECTEGLGREQSAYYVVFNFKTDILQEMFGGFENADMPLRGVHLVSMFDGLGDPPKRFFKKVPSAVGSIFLETAPFYDKDDQQQRSDISMGALDEAA